MTKVSPIAEFLRVNKATTKRDKYGCHFYSPEGLYLGRLTKANINNYRVISLETFGEGFKKMYTKSVAIGQQYAYITNTSSPIGISITPVKTYMRKIFVDFIERKSTLEDTERTLKNKLDLIAVDDKTGVGLYDTDKPFRFDTVVTNSKSNTLRHPQYTHQVH